MDFEVLPSAPGPAGVAAFEAWRSQLAEPTSRLMEGPLAGVLIGAALRRPHVPWRSIGGRWEPAAADASTADAEQKEEGNGTHYDASAADAEEKEEEGNGAHYDASAAGPYAVPEEKEEGHGK